MTLKTTLLPAGISLVLVWTIGCRPASQATSSNTQSADQSDIVIVANQVPSEANRQAMLQAKDDLFQSLSGRLKEVMSGQGPTAAISVCKNEATQIAKEVSEKHGLQIGRTGVRLRNLNNQPPEWAKELTDNKVDEPTFVSLSNGNAAALLPIKLQSQCLMCHGPRDEIAPIIQEQLTKLYPDDRATGFREGELRGWFWVEMPTS
ncbi:DUF3365 domain-containing protein [Rhodopirellula sp. JC740]|uniref:DUF3365 domain-containing protein n=1 Tax=Rhodopirellula halodulae TaxID=2894198 RepID=A0ABS8NH65_9BACT|nr:DUF3365 domain-containing protein [Rhodopirellula sp. JC740]MCC9642905.1 DUF3365 domain-containing protein [Rhodopirellula sp. JC740]